MVVIDLLNGTNATRLFEGATLTTNSPVAPIINVTVLNQLNFTQWFILACMTYVAIIVFHELGHWMMLEYYKKQPRITFLLYNRKPFLATVPEEMTETPQQRLAVIIGGFIGGFVPIIAASIIHPYVWLLAIPYAVMIQKDILKAAQCYKEMNPVRKFQ